MTTSRSTIAPPGSAGYYHCVSRCVRRAWLCGSDRLTGRSYDHRRDWVVTRLTELASIFGVRVLAYAAMSNHLHLALEFDPAWVDNWTDVECLNRWLRLYCPADYSEQQRARRIFVWLGQPERIAQIRQRLASVSEFMKCLNENIARLANLEDGCTGRFWEGRFRCQRLLDERSVLSAMVYVDLNPIRATMASDLESSDYTSIQQRLRETAERLGDVDKLLQPVAGVPGELALGISVRHYLGLVDWTGRVMHPTKRGKIDGAAPSVLDVLGLRENGERRPALLDRLALSNRAWTAQVKGTELDFYRVIGAAEQILAYAEDIGQRWLQGIGVARLLNERRAKPKPA
ncbi:MAG: hypothetical protein KDI48_19850 [Xanthomonadales bacterium]|nr:hypothetical protein [Xanthomonadales bacterium]